MNITNSNHAWICQTTFSLKFKWKICNITYILKENNILMFLKQQLSQDVYIYHLERHVMASHFRVIHFDEKTIHQQYKMQTAKPTLAKQ